MTLKEHFKRFKSQAFVKPGEFVIRLAYYITLARLSWLPNRAILAGIKRPKLTIKSINPLVFMATPI